MDSVRFSINTNILKLLIPREHGVWAMWVAPFILGVVYSEFTLQSIIFFFTALLLFMMNSPLSALMKSSRRRDEHLSAVIIAGILFGIPSAFLLLTCFSSAFILLGTLCVFLLGIHLITQRYRKNMTLPVHMTGIAGLTMTAPMVYLLNTGTFDATAAWLWVINFLYFSTTTFYIRLRIRIQSRMSGSVTVSEKLRIGAPAVISSCIPAVVMAAAGLPLLIVPFIPGFLKALWGSLFFQPGKKSKPIVLGITEIIFTLLFIALTALVRKV